MKYKIKIGKKYITITPKPEKNIRNGIKVYLNKALNEYSEPIATTDIIKNKNRYFYKSLGEDVKIIKAEIYEII